MSPRRWPFACNSPKFVGPKPVGNPRNNAVGDRLSIFPVVDGRIVNTEIGRINVAIEMRHSLVWTIQKWWVNHVNSRDAGY
jgi:hypothetical protein